MKTPNGVNKKSDDGKNTTVSALLFTSFLVLGGFFILRDQKIKNNGFSPARSKPLILALTRTALTIISIIDVEKNEVLGQIEVGETPHGISFSKDKTIATGLIMNTL